MSAKGFLKVSLAVLAMISGAGGALAGGLRDITGPAEIPPASYTAKQYVDSAGCVFVRAGYGGSTIWVPRVTRQGTAFCGQQPSRANVPSAKPRMNAHAEAPVIVPVVPRRVAAVAVAPVVAGGAAGAQAAQQDTPRIPKGFRAAWSDGRLNRNRGPRTAEGDARMARVWTNTVPMHLRQVAQPKAPASPHVMRASSNLSPAAGGKFVQLGTFGIPANARAALARLQALGLPGNVRHSRLGKQDVQIVLAGPFTSAAAVSQALSAARAAGYGDAFVRR